MFFLSYSSDHRALHSFPTRRSSDLLLCPSPLSLSLLPALLIDGRQLGHQHAAEHQTDRKSTRLNSSHVRISYAVFCLKKKKNPLLDPSVKVHIQSQNEEGVLCTYA